MITHITAATTNGVWLVDGVQLTPRKFVHRRIGDFILWLFFHRTNTRNTVKLSGFLGGE